MRTFSTVCLSLMCFVAGGADTKNPWQWTTAERIQARMSKERAQERVAEFLARNPGATVPQNVVEGAVNPELVMPAEAFRFLIIATFVDERIAPFKKSELKRASSDILKTDEEWAQLADAAADYISDLRAYETLGAEGGRVFGVRLAEVKAEMKQRREAQCPKGKKALEAAYGLFEKTAFDRLLYLQISPKITLFWDEPPGNVEAELAREARCAGF